MIEEHLPFSLRADRREVSRMNRNGSMPTPHRSTPKQGNEPKKGLTRLQGDRRSRRTLAALQNSLIELLLQKPLREITITELTDAADISRTTFYIHFTDINDLFHQMEDDIYRQFEKIIHESVIDSTTVMHMEIDKSGNIYLPTLYEVFKFINDNTDLCVVLLTNPDSTFLKRIWAEGHTTLMNKTANVNDKKYQRSVEYYYYLVANGIRGLIEHWLESGMRETVDEVYRIAANFVLHNLAFLQQGGIMGQL